MHGALVATCLSVGHDPLFLVKNALSQGGRYDFQVLITRTQTCPCEVCHPFQTRTMVAAPLSYKDFSSHA